ncbi:MAG TPA: imidazole glycerol phosphate synthase subunit HisH, partial [Candidatus Hydrogenedentes bacterium]|nr:imidazole glycerol phosphate synthase subunit HisH [Candidatus Hydrogenedentota bacterium]
EGDVDGLGWIEGETKKFRFEDGDPLLKIPHMGWNDLPTRKASPLFEGVRDDACFYFAHSYYVECDNEDAVLCTTHYGHDFVSGIALGNIYGTQFHPEKSHANGLRVVRNFIRLSEHA